jgi:hypothetical protein
MQKLIADQKMKEGLQLSTQTEAEQQAKWGFLKNIININTFFSSGLRKKSNYA